MGAPALLASRIRSFTPQLRFGLRVTVAGVAAFALARSLNFPLHGLWAVLTAIEVSQISVGGSLRATVEYNIGTLCGAVYAAVIGLLVPHTTPLAQALVLALSVGPLAFAAAISPSFRGAPFYAVLVLLIGGEFGESPVGSAVTRVLEVAIGGAVALAASLFVLPERAQALGLGAAARILNDMSALLDELLARTLRESDKLTVSQAQTRLGASVTAFQALADEARRERFISIARKPDPAALGRALLRLRHDLAMLGRATVTPLPETITNRIEAPLGAFRIPATAFLREAATALAGNGPPPPIGPTQAGLAAYSAEIASLRSDGVLRALETTEVERVFAAGFTLEQLCRNLADLAPRIEEYAARGRQ